MKECSRKALRTTFILSFLFVLPGIAQEQQKETPTVPTKEKQPKKTPVVADVPVYKPPLRGAPSGRVGGGTRGIPSGPLGAGTRAVPDRSVLLSVLTPDHSGLTTQEQPSLYWYLSQLATYPVELTLIEISAVKPILETRISPPSLPGVQRIRLADYGVRLKTGVEYRWFVAIVPDPNNRSKDILAGGFIERVDTPANLRARLSQTGSTQAAFVYAEEGIWYDALSAISDKIDASPNDSTLRKQRAALLDQVGLKQVAEHDLSRSDRK